MKKLYFILVAFLALVLLGCNGHKNDSSQSSSKTVANIELLLLDSNGNAKQSFTKNETITLQARVTDEYNAIITNKKVDFTADIGELEIASKLTNSDGIAIVSITNETLSLGAGTVGASAGEITAQSIEYEYIDDNSTTGASGTSYNIISVMTLNGESINQFKSDQEAQVTATLTDNNGAAVANEIITFSADIGSLNTATALTNNAGVASVTLTSDDANIGAGVLTSSYSLDDDSSISSAFNYQVLSSDALIDSNVRLGYFDDTDNFVEGEIELSIAGDTISAGGSLGVSVDVIDENGDLIVTPVAVTFTSNCVQNGNASIDESVLSINGTASSTYTDIDCAGTTGTDDVIVASVSINSISNTANTTISITGEALGSIEFISAEPTSIVLKGTGGQNQQETSTLTFRVKSQLGNVLAQQTVDFALTTSVGDITLSRESGVTNSQGLVTTQVSSGTVPTAVRVTASATLNNKSVQSQSDLLSINTGLPEQRSMTISATELNPEANNLNGEEVTITAWLSDNFNNPVPDGTTVNFTTEGGNITPSCTTVNGSCSVTWTSSEPRVADHRITVLAYALGHETFFDTNGNNYFDDNDIDTVNGPIEDAGVNSGFSNYPAQAIGFIDMSEAWRDDNENSNYDIGETFINFDNDTAFSGADGVFNGPQCEGSACAPENIRSTHVRKALVLVMASSEAETILTNSDGSVTYENSLTGESNLLPDVVNGNKQSFVFSFADTGTPNQTMPIGTTVEIEISAGSIEGDTNFTVGNNNYAGFNSMNFDVVQEDGDAPDNAILTITITSPNGFITALTKNIALL